MWVIHTKYKCEGLRLRLRNGLAIRMRAVEWLRVKPWRFPASPVPIERLERRQCAGEPAVGFMNDVGQQPGRRAGAVGARGDQVAVEDQVGHGLSIGAGGQEKQLKRV